MAMSRRTWQRSRTGVLFALPWLVGFFGWTLVPMIASALLSLCRWNGFDLGRIEWVGLANYKELFTKDPDVGLAFWNSFSYAVVAVPLGLAAALGLAMLLNQKLRGISVFRTIFYLPHVVAGVATIVMWQWIFNPDFGFINTAIRGFYDTLAWLGIEAAREWPTPDWLYSDFWAKPALVIMSLWGTGGAMLIFLAALQNVPDHLYEAARIDGAGRWQQFRHVTLPHLTPAIFFNLIMGIIAALQIFNEPYLLNHAAQNDSLLFYVLHLYYRAFQDLRFGYGSALAWVLFVVILSLTMLVLRSGRLWVYYEGE